MSLKGNDLFLDCLGNLMFLLLYSYKQVLSIKIIQIVN